MDKIEFKAFFQSMHWYTTGHKNKPVFVDDIEFRPVDCDNDIAKQLVTFFEGKNAYKITIEKITRSHGDIANSIDKAFAENAPELTHQSYIKLRKEKEGITGRMAGVLLKSLKKFQQITVMMHNCQGMIDEIEAVLIDAGFEKEVMAERALRRSYAQEN